MIKRHHARFRAYRMGARATLAKGVPYRRIIALAFVKPNNEYALHATKGYRWRRLPKNENALLNWLMERIQ